MLLRLSSFLLTTFLTVVLTSGAVYAEGQVNLVTGNMYLQAEDLHIKGRGGLDFRFNRSYNSLAPKDGPLGFGWTHNYNQYLLFIDANTNNVTDAEDTDTNTSSAIWYDSTSAIRQFGVLGTAAGIPVNTSLTAPASIYYQVQRTGTGTYTIREPNGLIYTFESIAGTVGQKAKLTKITDRNDNAMTLTYTGSNLTTITDALNRSLTFSYDSNNRITQMSDWTGRQYRYEYDTVGNLVTYRDPLTIKGKHPATLYQYYADGSVDSLGQLSPRNHALKSQTRPGGISQTFEYYMNGQVFKEYNALGETNTYSFNPYRRETVLANSRGFTRHYQFDPNGMPINITLENGGSNANGYDCAQPGTANCANPFNKTSTQDAAGISSSIAYDAQGNVTALTKPAGSSSYSYFNAFGMPGVIVDRNWNYTFIKYDAKGNVLENIAMKWGYYDGIDPATYVPDPAQVLQWTINTYDVYGNLKTSKRVKDATTQAGQTTTYTYDATGLNLLTIARTGLLGTGLSGTQTTPTFTYDTLGRMLTGVDNDWYAIQKSYDDLDRVITATDKVGNLSHYAYDGNNNLINAQVSVAGVVKDNVSYQYDLAGRKIMETDNGGFSTRFAYDAAGNLLKKTNPDGYITTYEYDEANKLTRTLDAKGQGSSYQRDMAGRLIKITDPNGLEQSFKYGYNGNLQSKIVTGTGPVEYYYDANDNLTMKVEYSSSWGTVNDQTPKVTETSYDELNRPIRILGPTVTDPVYGQVRPLTLNTYDLFGNLTQVSIGRTDTSVYPAIDNVAVQFTYTWDDFGHRLTKTDALNKSWTYKYDTYGNLTQSTDALAQSLFYTWGYGHQLSCITKTTADATCAVNTNLLKKYTRDGIGQVTQAYTPGVTYTYTYTPNHHINTVLDSRGSKTLTYSWSNGGQLNRLASSEGQVVNYQYDPLGRLSGVYAPNGDYVSLAWDRGGRLVEKWFPNGINTQFSYNLDGTLSQVKNRRSNSDVNLVSQHDYLYDGYKNRIQHTEIINGVSDVTDYVYDDLMRLVSSTQDGITKTYQYDMLNNRTAVLTTDALGVTTSEYAIFDAANQKTAVRSGSATGPLLSAMVYDANGNLTTLCSGGTVTGTDTACTGASVTANTYDFLSRTTAITKTGQLAQSYDYDDQNRRIRKTVGTVVSNYLYQGEDILAEYANGWTTATGFITHGATTDVPLTWQPIATDLIGPRYFHQDGLGSIVAMSTTTGTTDTERFDPWGAKLVGSGAIPVYGFTGREQDGTPTTGTGFIYYRARYYDPQNGRFTQRDPIELKGGNNLYSYVGGNPVNIVDPNGLLGQGPGGGDTQAAAVCAARVQCLALCTLENQTSCAPIGMGAGTIVGGLTAGVMACVQPELAYPTYQVVNAVVVPVTSIACGRILSPRCTAACGSFVSECVTK